MNTLYEFIQNRSSETPGSTAIIDINNQRFTYLDLAHRLKSLMAGLSGLQFQRNDRVAIVLPNGREMAMEFLAVASIASAAPLNPAYSFDEFTFYLSDLQAKALITTPDVAPAAVRAAEAMGIPVISSN